jgi:hypothetical protein
MAEAAAQEQRVVMLHHPAATRAVPRPWPRLSPWR